MDLRPFQVEGIRIGEEFFASANRGDKRVLHAPTGVGKSVMELALMEEGRVIVTPSLEIVSDLLRKLGREAPEAQEALAEAGQAAGIWTPIRLRNRLAEGVVPQPAGIIADEVHHATADSWQDLHALAGFPPILGFTATPFRGTARGTVRFREEWGEPTTLISISEAADAGYISIPECSVKPLFDDDLVEVRNGEFVIESANEVIGSRISDACEFIAGLFPLTKPTIVSLPSTECVHLFAERLGDRACRVLSGIGRSDRLAAFRDTLACERVLLQIKVVGEGVDLPLRRLVDLRPTLSPVAFLQQIGRIMRPGGGSEYISCCRNLLRHAYLLDGQVPPAVVAQATQLFGGAGLRAAYRSIGLEAVGRFKPGEVHFSDGNVGQIFALSATVGRKVIQYSVLAHPCYPEPIVVQRDYVSGTPGGKWALCDMPDLNGFASVGAGALSEKQLAWWKRDAARYGLDAARKPNRKEFQALPILCHLKRRFA